MKRYNVKIEYYSVNGDRMTSFQVEAKHVDSAMKMAANHLIGFQAGEVVEVVETAEFKEECWEWGKSLLAAA